MTKEFVTYEQALALKELGFDEPCFSIYYSKDKSFSWHHHKNHTNDEPVLDTGEFNISAPLKQQAFRWFREKHKLHSYVHLKANGLYRGIVQIDYLHEINYVSIDFVTYEEAEQACLDKLIEICKNK